MCAVHCIGLGISHDSSVGLLIELHESWNCEDNVDVMHMTVDLDFVKKISYGVNWRRFYYSNVYSL